MTTNWLNRCAEMDSDSCARFTTEAKASGFNVRKSTKVEDMGHVDYFLTKNGKTFAVDLKSQKRGVEDGLFLIELLNVRGDLGWLFGKAEFIVFDTPQGFQFVTRSLLYLRMRAIFGFYASKSGVAFDKRTTYTSSPQEAIAPACYCREDRPKERISYVRGETIQDLFINFSCF